MTLRFGEPESDDTRVLIVPSITDNRGNGAVLNKLVSTRFPSSAVLVELATYMKARGMRTVVEWAPRECNKETISQRMYRYVRSVQTLGSLFEETLLVHPPGGVGGRERSGAHVSRHEADHWIAQPVSETTKVNGDQTQDHGPLLSLYRVRSEKGAQFTTF